MPNRMTISFLAAMAMVLAACATGAPAVTAPVDGQAATPSHAPSPAGCVVGVSWSNMSGRFGRWDEPAIKDAVTAAGATYRSNDAQSSETTQASNVEALIAGGANVLIVLAQNGTGMAPSMASAHEHGIPVIAYDRLIDDPATLYLTFDNVEVGRMQAWAVLKVVPKGSYVFIKGDEDDANSDFLRSGQAEVLAAALRAGAIRNVGETYTPDWAGGLAEVEMESFLVANHNKIDAVLSQNDGMAGGVLRAMSSHRLSGTAAVSGQDGEALALNAVALGSLTVDVWKDARVLGKAAGEAAVALCGGATIASLGVTDFKTQSGASVPSMLLAPVAVTQDNLDVVVDAGWITRADLCDGVTAGSVAACP
jgi:D-xylose transport system substrate-binding protein